MTNSNIKKYKLLVLLLGTMVMIPIMMITGAQLKTPSTPGGILALEFAYNKTIALQVIKAWTSQSMPDRISIAKINTKLDFIFLFFYSLFLFSATTAITALYNDGLFRLGKFIANCALLAGFLDILENIGMLFTLQGHILDSITFSTFIWSLTKWALVFVVLLYILIVLLLFLYRKRRVKTPMNL